MQKGEPVLLGSGDLHDPAFDGYARSAILDDTPAHAAAANTLYTLTVYPTYDMFAEFQDQVPMAVALSFVGIIFLCSCVFLIYDCLMRHEAYHRKRILEIKRRFVRFISHEIR